MNQSWENTPRVLWVHTDSPDICTFWRVWQPGMELSARGYVADYCAFADIGHFTAVLKYGRYNTIITPRMTFNDDTAEKQWLEIIEPIRSKVKWICDYDDDILTPRFNKRQLEINDWPDPDEIAIGLEKLRQSRLRMLRKADGVTVVSQPLVDIVQSFTNAPVFKVPNGLNVYPYTLLKPRLQNKPITIGWSGGPRLEADLEPLYEVWPKVAELRPNVNFVLQGYLPSRMVAALPAGRLSCQGGVQMEQYPEVLQGIDIFCCIAGADKWNLAKSPIKWFEATLAGCACVVSRDLYGSVIDPPYAALVASTPDEWLKALLALVDDQALRQTVHAAALETVLAKHTLRSTYKAWLDAWSAVLVN